MEKIRFYKLVRDKIPEIIQSAGRQCSTFILSDKDYARFLDDKLIEEVNEYRDSKRMEELADVLEVIHGIVEARGNTWDELEELRLEMRKNHGGFDKQILMTEFVDDPA